MSRGREKRTEQIYLSAGEVLTFHKGRLKVGASGADTSEEPERHNDKSRLRDWSETR